MNNVVYEVTVTEMDRFSGPEVLEVLHYESEAEARAYANEYNSKNRAANAPDCYIFAKVTPVLRQAIIKPTPAPEGRP